MINSPGPTYPRSKKCCKYAKHNKTEGKSQKTSCHPGEVDLKYGNF